MVALAFVGGTLAFVGGCTGFQRWLSVSGYTVSIRHNYVAVQDFR